jgi:DNA (cytosine-5)-methyltransferase 3A
MNVLSLFDGISCGQVALERAGFKVDNYFASEIEPKAIKVTQKHYPNTIQLGDVTKVTGDILDQMIGIDILMGGSPCQDLSAYKLNRNDAKGLEGSKSKLFYHYERIFKYVKPKYFLLENVVMDKEWEDIITEILGVEPVLINSSLVSAAERKRLYWTNIPGVSQPTDKGILIKDIIITANEVPDKYWYNLPFIYNGDDKKVQCTLDVQKGFQRNMKEVYNQNAKCNTLLADGDGGNRQKKVYQDGRCRKFMPIEYERMQTLPDNYTDCVSDSARYSAIGNGWTVDVIAHILKGMELS